MANARIQRSAAEGGRLPKLCICCGEPAAEFVHHSFRWQPGWWLLLSVPLIGLLLFGVMALLAYLGVPRLIRRAVLLAMFGCLLPMGNGNSLVVPVCSAHGYRLKWHEFFLWFLLVVLVPVAAVGLYAAVNHDVQTSESILFCCVLGAPLLLAASIAIRFFTPRLTAAESGHIDMAMLSKEFVHGLADPQANMHTRVSKPTGRPLPSGLAATPRWVFIAGGGAAAFMALTVLGCGGTFVFLTWYQHQMLREMVARNEARANVRLQPPEIPHARAVPPELPARNLAPPLRPATRADQPETAASSQLDRTAAAAGRRGRRPTGAAPGFELQSAQEVQADDLLHVRTEEIWRMGVATEVAESQVRVRLMGARPSGGEWYALEQLRHTRPPAIRAALARSRPKLQETADTASSSSLPADSPKASSLPESPPDPTPPGQPTTGRAAHSEASPHKAPAPQPTSEPPNTSTSSLGTSTPVNAPAERSGKLRTWTDASGKFRIEAELINVDGEQAILRKENGSVVRIPLTKLSLEDRLQAIAQSP